MRILARETITNYLFLLIAIVLWASAFVGIRIGLKSYSPGTLALLRFAIASIFLIPLYIKSHTSVQLTRNERIAVFLLGFLGIGVYHTALNYGEITVSAGLASFIIGLSPVFTVVLAFFFLKEKLSATGWIGISISLVGILLIALSQGGKTTSIIGMLAILVAAITTAIYAVGQKYLLQKVNAIKITSLTFWAGTICLLVFLPSLPQELKHASATATLAVIYLGIFPSIVAYICYSMALKKLSVTKTTNTLYLTPLISSLLGWILLNEKVAILAFVGGCIALIGTLTVQSSKQN